MEIALAFTTSIMLLGVVIATSDDFEAGIYLMISSLITGFIILMLKKGIIML